MTDVDGGRQTRGRRGGWKAADVEAVAAYLASPAPATVLASSRTSSKSSSALWKACAKTGEVLDFDVAKKELQGWVAEQFRQRGARAEPEAVAALIQLVGDDLRALKVEVDKIATWAGDEPIGEREVEALVTPNADVPIYELTEAWSVRDAARALAVSETIFESDPKPRRDVAPRLAGSLASHLGRLRALKQLAAEGVKPKEAAERLKLHPFYAEKLYGQAEGFSDEELDDAVVRLAELDGALKGQSKLAPDLEVQRTLVASAGDREQQRAARGGYAAGGARRDEPRSARLLARAVLACSAPRVVARSIVRTSSRCSAATRSASPSETAVSRRFVSVLIVER